MLHVNRNKIKLIDENNSAIPGSANDIHPPKIIFLSLNFFLIFLFKIMVVIFYFIAKKPSKFPYLKTVKISLKPDRLSMSKFPFCRKWFQNTF